MTTPRFTRAAIALTAIWLLICAAFVVAKIFAVAAGEATLQSALLRWSLADFGQFVGGVVAVPAFGWIALTFFLQRDSLAVSIDALTTQAIGLRAQTDLLRHDLHMRAAPRFQAQIVRNPGYEAGIQGYPTYLNVENQGADIRDVVFYLDTFGATMTPTLEVRRLAHMRHQDATHIHYPVGFQLPGLLTVSYSLVDGQEDQLQYAFVRADVGSPVVRWLQ